MTLRLLGRGFYARDTVRVARDLLGKRLVRRIGDAEVFCTITETEAYKHEEDPASHAYNGMTERNRAMFGEVGRAYVYFTYGMHYCVNAVARGGRSKAGAVLIRAARPVGGVDIMIRNRGKKAGGMRGIADGPAKLAQAMQIDSGQYGADLTKRADGLFVTEGSRGGGGGGGAKNTVVRTSARIGISRAADKRWNFSLKD